MYLLAKIGADTDESERYFGPQRPRLGEGRGDGGPRPLRAGHVRSDLVAEGPRREEAGLGDGEAGRDEPARDLGHK